MIEVQTFYKLIGLERLEERKIFYIDVGKMKPRKAQRYIAKVLKRHKNKNG